MPAKPKYMFRYEVVAIFIFFRQLCASDVENALSCNHHFFLEVSMSVIMSYFINLPYFRFFNFDHIKIDASQLYQ